MLTVIATKQHCMLTRSPRCYEATNNSCRRGAAIAPWSRLCLPSCGRGFKSQVPHLCFSSICIIEIVIRKGQKYTKRGRDRPIFNTTLAEFSTYADS